MTHLYLQLLRLAQLLVDALRRGLDAEPPNYATFRESPLPSLLPGDPVELDWCERHGITAFRVAGPVRECWSCTAPARTGGAR